jgi:hypothetical protein
MTPLELVQSIEARTTALCRESVAATSDRGETPAAVAHMALQTAVDEHAVELREHPGLAQQYASDLEHLAATDPR